MTCGCERSLPAIAATCCTSTTPIAPAAGRLACNSCVGRLRSGAVRNLRTGHVERADGQMVRTCVSAAAGAVEIDL